MRAFHEIIIMEVINMSNDIETSTPKNSAAKVAAADRYNKKHYRNISIRLQPNDVILIDTHCKENNISKAKFIVAACKYCIDNKIKFED